MTQERRSTSRGMSLRRRSIPRKTRCAQLADGVEDQADFYFLHDVFHTCSRTATFATLKDRFDLNVRLWLIYRVKLTPPKHPQMSYLL